MKLGMHSTEDSLIFLTTASADEKIDYCGHLRLKRYFAGLRETLT